MPEGERTLWMWLVPLLPWKNSVSESQQIVCKTNAKRHKGTYGAGLVPRAKDTTDDSSDNGRDDHKDDCKHDEKHVLAQATYSRALVVWHLLVVGAEILRRRLYGTAPSFRLVARNYLRIALVGRRPLRDLRVAVTGMARGMERFWQGRRVEWRLNRLKERENKSISWLK